MPDVRTASRDSLNLVSHHVHTLRIDEMTEELDAILEQLALALLGEELVLTQSSSTCRTCSRVQSCSCCR